MKKKVLSALLCLCMVFSLVPALSLTALAASESDVIAFKNKYDGTKIYNHGDQCVALFNQYLEEVFGIGFISLTSAYEIYDKVNDRNCPGWTKIPQNSITNYQVGDIIVWNPWHRDGLDNNDGHVAIVTSVSGTVKIFEQSLSENAHERKIYFEDSIRGIIRPNLSSSTPVSTDTSGYVTVPNGTYELAPATDLSMRLDVAWGSSESGANIQVYAANQSTSQQFAFTSSGGAFFEIVAQCSNMALDAAYGGTDSGSNVQQWERNGSDPQRWVLFDAGDGYYYISPKTNTNLVLDVDGGGTANGTNVQVYAKNNTVSQKWRIIPSITAASIAEGTYTLTPQNATDKRLDVAGGSTADGATLQIYEANSSEAQQFTFASAGSGYYMITAKHSGKALDVLNGRATTGVSVQQYTSNGSDAQLWILESAGSGCYYIHPKLNPILSLDVMGGNRTNGTAVQLYTNNNSVSQKWKLEQAAVVPTNVAVTGVTLNKSSLALAVGGSETLTATVAPANATDKTVKWSSSDTSVATVSNGRVTGVKAGTTTITASAGGKSASCSVTVAANTVAVQSVALSNSTLSLAVGESNTLTATVSPSNATDKTVTWSSNNTSVATVSNGRVTGVKAGTATITASAGGKTASCTVTVSEKQTAPTMTTENLTSASVGNSYQATLAASGTTPISWSVSSGSLPDGLTLDASSGRISGTPTKAGTFKFTVTARNSAGSTNKEFSLTVGTVSVTLSFQTNGGTAVSSVSCAKGGSVYLSNYTTTREGFDFTGWYKDAALSERVSELTISENTTVYAGWKEKAKQQQTQPVAGSEVHFEKQTIYHQDMFSDIPANQWYTEAVAAAYEYGLMKGDSDTTFAPYGDVTIAEAVTMAARIHSIYTTGSESFDQSVGNAWYQTYMDYAYQNSLISYAYYNSDATQKATRAQFAEIFAASLPDEALAAINSVADNAIPDVSMSADFAQYVYKLYRAGILIGSDSNGTFNPQTYITRAESAAIVSRMADSGHRVSITL